MEATKKYFSLKHEIETKAEMTEKERTELNVPVHSGSIEYQGKSSKNVLENVKLNELGKVGTYSYI